MKALTIVLSLLCLILSACLVLPAPNLLVIPAMVILPEIAPWLFVFNLFVLTLALRFCWPTIPLIILSSCIACWPVLQAMQVTLQTTNLNELNRLSKPGFYSVFAPGLHMPAASQIKVHTLPHNIIYHEPPTVGRHPALINIYGGAWQRGTPRDTNRFDAYMASRGYAVFAIEYRHAPAFQFPAQVEDVNTALHFLFANAARYNLDTTRTVLCGQSSGAQLALLAAYAQQEVPIRAVVSFYGPTDLISGYWDRPSPDPIDVRAVLRTYLGGSPNEQPDRYRTASPVHYVRRNLPATLIIAGGHDHIVKAQFAEELYSQLAASGNKAALLILPWSEHGFDLVFSGLGNQLSLYYLEAFLQAELNH